MPGGHARDQLTQHYRPVRHLDTSYDKLLMSGVLRSEARSRIHPDVQACRDGWRGPAT